MMEVETEIIEEIIDSKEYHKPMPEYGSRAWLIKGKKMDVLYWDLGNGWAAILDVIPHNGEQKEVIKFYRKLKKKISETYDVYGYKYG